MNGVELVVYSVNGSLIVIVFVLGVLLVRYASIHNYALGEGEKQLGLQKKIMKLITAIFVIACLAAVFNILVI